MNVVGEHTTKKGVDLSSDIPFAIFMMKLLHVKVRFHNMTEDDFVRYFGSDKPIKFRYYLQVKMKEELQEAEDAYLSAGMHHANADCQHPGRIYFTNVIREIITTKFKTKKSVDILLYSIRDVVRAGLA